MGVEEFIAANWLVIGSGVIALATIIATIRNNLSRIAEKIDVQTKHMDKRFDALNEKDREHDGEIQRNALHLANHDRQIAVVETRLEGLTGWMRDMKEKINHMYEYMFKGDK